MYDNNSHKKILIILLLSVLAVFVAHYFILTDIKKKGENVSSLLTDLSSQLNREEYVSSTNKLIESIHSDVDRINSSIISTTGDVDFIENLEAIAHDNGLSIVIDSLLFEDDPKSKSNGITTLKIKAETDGSWSGTYKFLEQIESLPFKIKINQFNLMSSEGQLSSDGKKITNSNKSWQTTFEIRVLKYK